jgi:adenosylmethionine---8-amino-7-oxononanoate aminotransferase
MGITMASNKIFEAFLSNDRAKTFFHGHSYTGNPISAAAALASLDIFETEPVFGRIKSIETAHAKHAPALAAKHNLKHRQIGTIAAFEPMDTTGYLSTKSLEWSKRALEMGLLIRPLGDTLYLLPPYASTPEDLAFVYEVLNGILAN